jgi:hypothetical protein
MRAEAFRAAALEYADKLQAAGHASLAIEAREVAARLSLWNRSTRLTYRGANEVCASMGARLMTRAELHRLAEIAHRIEPTELSYGPEMVTIEQAQKHDAIVAAKLRATQWDRQRPVINDGKYWLAGATGNNVTIGGILKGNRFIQQGIGDNPHHLNAARSHTDYMTLTRAVIDSDDDEQPPTERDSDMATVRPTLRIGQVNPHVKIIQSKLNLLVDGRFGPATLAAVMRIQKLNGLLPDGIVGAKTWQLFGETWGPAGVTLDKRAPACLAAIRDADARWPKRSRASDGIMGDEAHQKRPSDHNTGDAVDITHDPANDCDAGLIAKAAIDDERVTYVIWQGHIFNRARSAEGWRKRDKGDNDHTHHCHISVKREARNDVRPWAWAPDSKG